MDKNQNKPTANGLHMGGSSFLFSLIATALFVCVLVPVLLSCAGNPSPKLKPYVGAGYTPPAETPTESEFVPLFVPSANIKPYVTRQTATAELDSAYGVLVNSKTGEIVAGKNADQKFHPASMTKVMTLLVACQRLSTEDLEKKIKLTQEIYDYVHPATASDGYFDSECYWRNVYIGDDGTLLSQLYGIGMESYADCTVMVATYIVGKSPAESEAQFVEWMNEEVEKMGLKNTHFDNIIGHESDDNYTTAADMAAIMIRALECPLIADLLSAKEAKHFYIDSYNPDGSFDQQYNMFFYSTLFNVNDATSNREKAYEAVHGKFKLNSLTLQGGKTGALKVDGKWVYSLVSYATSSSDKSYVAVTGETTVGSSVLKDAKTLYDNYGK